MAFIVSGLNLPNSGRTCVTFRLPTGAGDLTEPTLLVLNGIKDELLREGIEVSFPAKGKMGEGVMECPGSCGSIILLTFALTDANERWQVRTLYSVKARAKELELTEADRARWERICSVIDSTLRTRLLATDLDWITFETAEIQCAS